MERLDPFTQVGHGISIDIGHYGQGIAIRCGQQVLEPEVCAALDPAPSLVDEQYPLPRCHRPVEWLTIQPYPFKMRQKIANQYRFIVHVLFYRLPQIGLLHAGIQRIIHGLYVLTGNEVAAVGHSTQRRRRGGGVEDGQVQAFVVHFANKAVFLPAWQMLEINVFLLFVHQLEGGQIFIFGGRKHLGGIGFLPAGTGNDEQQHDSGQKPFGKNVHDKGFICGQDSG